MLKTTKELIAYLKLEKSKRDYTIVDSSVYAILKCGNKGDAEAILKQFLTNPCDFHYAFLLKIFKKFGDHFFAEQLFQATFQENKLMENMDPEILEVLGYLHYEPIKKILAAYAFGDSEADYYASKHAVLGLIHFDCDEYATQIVTAIENCYGKSYFAEFVPALVCKLKNRTSTLEKLYELGNEFASIDCNSGIILGFSLCGEEGEKYFKKILFNKHWATCDSGTGSRHVTYKGIKNLGISFKSMYLDIKDNREIENLEYNLEVLFALLEMRMNDFENNKEESYADIHTSLFQWENENKSNNIIDLARSVDKMEEAHEIKKLLEQKLKEEAILKNYGT